MPIARTVARPSRLAPLGERRLTGAVAPRAHRRGRGLAGAGPRPARLRAQERLPLGHRSALSGGIDSARGRRDRGRRARRRAACTASRCRAATRREHSRDDAADLAQRTGLRLPRRCRSQPMVDAFLANLALSGLAVENLQARVRGVDPDGAVQPGGPPGADHRQQERARGRLLHALRRLGRRLQPAQGRAEDAGVAAGPVAQRRGGAARRDAADPGELDRPSRRAPSCAPASSTPTRCPTTTCSTRSSPTTSRATRAAPSCSRPGTTRRWSTGCCGMVDLAEYKRRQSAPGPKISHQGVRPRPPAADHQPVPRARRRPV